MNVQTTELFPLKIADYRQGQRFPYLSTLGIPFAEGQLQVVDHLALTNDQGELLDTAFHATAFWPDGSIKWCVIKVITGHLENVDMAFSIVQPLPSNRVNISRPCLTIQETTDEITVIDTAYCYRFKQSNNSLFPTLSKSKEDIWVGTECHAVLTDNNNNVIPINLHSCELVQQDTLTATVELHADAKVALQKPIKLVFRYNIIVGGRLSLSVEIHNPNRAIHANGIWDLGDEGSFNFNGFSLSINQATASQVNIQASPDKNEVTLDSSQKVLLFQSSSGGKHWDSPTHVDASGNNNHEFCGFTLRENEVTIDAGTRADPLVTVINDSDTGYAFYQHNFWQNFPSSLHLSSSQHFIGLFPEQHKPGHELQGGEKKHHHLEFVFNTDKIDIEQLRNQSPLTPNPEIIIAAGVLDYPYSHTYEPYNQLLQLSLDNSQGFIAKRENQDEYGWRNFGDVVADHEALYYEGKDIFVSHYNNQYDAIYGFARQYLLTGDDRWRRLMDDLARHVLDIDIYHTSEDRVEYNHGLFWHTDHYKPASTCTHRTYSNAHRDDQSNTPIGGGPGPEHCYTSGLKLYYFLTDNNDARSAVLGLSDWITHYYEGSGSILDWLHQLATKDRFLIKEVLKGQSVFRYRYPFNRGTGNYVRALLDSYEITQDESYMQRSEAVILNTFSCTDDIPSRGLDDVEFTWFYIIFLQEVIRYLDLKRLNHTYDAKFQVIRLALLHYAHWMVEHETPALESSKPLEYVNDTWIAQDIRKANVLYAAYRYEIDNREVLLGRAKEFRDYVIRSLSNSETLHFARLQILLLQNHGPSAYMDQSHPPYVGLDGLPTEAKNLPACFYTKRTLFNDLSLRLWQAIKNLDFRREVRWIKSRLG